MKIHPKTNIPTHQLPTSTHQLPANYCRGRGQPAASPHTAPTDAGAGENAVGVARLAADVALVAAHRVAADLRVAVTPGQVLVTLVYVCRAAGRRLPSLKHVQGDQLLTVDSSVAVITELSGEVSGLYVL